MRRELEPQVTVLGEEKKRIGSPLEVLLDPTRPSPVSDSLVIGELRRLYNAGFKVSTTKVGDKKGYSILTQEQNTDLWKRAGLIANSKLERLLQLEDFHELPDELRAKKMGEFIDKAKTYARVEKLLQITEGLSGQLLKNKLSEAKKSGLMSSEVFTEYLKAR